MLMIVIRFLKDLNRRMKLRYMLLIGLGSVGLSIYGVTIKNLDVRQNVLEALVNINDRVILCEGLDSAEKKICLSRLINDLENIGAN